MENNSEAVTRRCSVKEVFLKTLQKFRGKRVSQSLFFYKVAGLRLATFLKKRLRHRIFPVNFAKFSRALFFKEHLRWLLLTPLQNHFCFHQESPDQKIKRNHSTVNVSNSIKTHKELGLFLY